MNTIGFLTTLVYALREKTCVHAHSSKLNSHYVWTAKPVATNISRINQPNKGTKLVPSLFLALIAVKLLACA